MVYARRNKVPAALKVPGPVQHCVTVPNDKLPAAHTQHNYSHSRLPCKGATLDGATTFGSCVFSSCCLQNICNAEEEREGEGREVCGEGREGGVMGISCRNIVYTAF